MFTFEKENNIGRCSHIGTQNSVPISITWLDKVKERICNVSAIVVKYVINGERQFQDKISTFQIIFMILTKCVSKVRNMSVA